MMLGDQDINRSLFHAVSAGNVEEVRKIINSFGPSYSPPWSEGYALLCNAVENNHTEVAKLLLASGSKVNGKNSKPDNTPLHFAAINGNIEIVELLLNRGATVNAKHCFGITPLHNAVESKKMKIIDLLVSQGADVNAYDSNGTTPMHLALENCSKEIINILLSRVANVNAKEKYGRTYIHIAAERGYSQIVNHLLKQGAYVNNASQEGYTPLCLAVQKGHEEVVKLLLEHGAKVDVQDKVGKTVLHSSVERGHANVVKLLLQCGANVDAQDKFGESVLHSAVVRGYSVIIEHLLKHCPDVSNKSNRSALNCAVHGRRELYGEIVENLLQYGLTVHPEDGSNCELLHAAVEKGYLKIVQEFLKYGVDVNVLYGTGYMPLHVATLNKQEEVAKLLITYGADVNARDEAGKTPIFYATENADIKITKLLLTNKANVKDDPKLLSIAVQNECGEIIEGLLEHGADVNASDGCGRTALHFTALGKGRGLFASHLDSSVRGEIAKLLLSRGANVNAKTKNGLTALHAAAEKGYVEVVKVLLEYNADVNSKSKDEYGRTALHFASKGGHEQIVTVLLEHGSDINIMSKDNLTPLNLALAGISLVDVMVGYYDFDDDYYDRHHGVCARGNIAGNLKLHMVKMRTANLYVSEKNLSSISNTKEFSNIQNACEGEIARMKSEKVRNANVSYYDILTKGVSQLAMYAGNESIVHSLRSDDYKIKFPIYATMITSNFRKGVRRKCLLEQGNKMFHFLFNIFPQLPHDCTERIFSYLNDEDLSIFIGPCKPVSIQES
jgi:ankyrin repeat protein